MAEKSAHDIIYAALRSVHADAIESMKARCDALTAENDTLRKNRDALAHGEKAALGLLAIERAEVTRLSAQVASMRDALKPFAAHATTWPHPEDNLTVECLLHVNRAYEARLGTEDFRRAGAALSPSSPKADAIARVVEAARGFSSAWFRKDFPGWDIAQPARQSLIDALASLDQSEGK